MHNFNKNVALVTGSAGFIGFHISRKLLSEGWKVIGIDSMSDYYDTSLKESREKLLLQSNNYSSIHERVEKQGVLKNVIGKEKPAIILHLAGQAGVRYSLEDPRSYLEANIIGTFELLEAAKLFPPKHMLLASSSSAYGANDKMPFSEKDKADHQTSFYAATKKSTEIMAHSYSHLFDLPITMFRFFTVYGPWGRPDMALFKFTKNILKREKIDVFNHGEMSRDFTYIDDLTNAIWLLIKSIPEKKIKVSDKEKNDSLSPVAPFRIINIGNSKPQKLTDFIEVIEKALNMRAKKNYLPMQTGDLDSTWADTSLLRKLTNYKAQTSIQQGVVEFIRWYRAYYNIEKNY